MTASKLLSPEARKLRTLVIDALWGDRGVYLDSDRFVGTCPLCGSAVGVTFAGYAPRATLRCHGGCAEADIARHVGLGVSS